MSSQQVRDLYERFPYPIPLSDQPLLRDLAAGVALLFPGDELRGWRVLDAGCGTGHRLASLAKRYPKSSFTGLDLSSRSIEVARSLIQRYDLKNVFVARGDLLEADFEPRQFDLVISIGVLHHIETPAAAVRRLARWMKSDGVLLTWLYHPYGEFDRLLDRKLLRILAKASRTDPIELVKSLGLRLRAERYGMKPPPHGTHPSTQDAYDADAFLHPVVQAFSFDDVIGIFRGQGVDWVALNAVSRDGGGGLIDLQEVAREPSIHVTARKLLNNADLLESYLRLDLCDKVRVIELLVRPTGFSVIAGSDAALGRVDARIRSNAVRLGFSAAPVQHTLES